MEDCAGCGTQLVADPEIPGGLICPSCDTDLLEDLAECDHVGTGRTKKYDGGKRPLLCDSCHQIVGRWCWCEMEMVPRGEGQVGCPQHFDNVRSL